MTTSDDLTRPSSGPDSGDRPGAAERRKRASNEFGVLLSVLRQRMVLVGSITLFGLCAGGLILAMMPRLYRAESVLVLEPRDANIIDAPAVLEGTNSFSLPYIVRSEAEILSNVKLAKDVVANLSSQDRRHQRRERAQRPRDQRGQRRQRARSTSRQSLRLE